MLFQTPASLPFDAAKVETLLNGVRDVVPGDLAWEPRHASWFEPAADALLKAFEVARIAADPACCPAAAVPGGWPGLRYWRFHGSPRMYFTPYGEERVGLISDLIEPGDWCIFDNTASGAAIVDALRMQARLSLRHLHKKI